MKLRSKLTAIALSAALTFSCAAMAACGDANSNNIDPEIYAVYTAYTEGGGTLSYEEWYAELLESAKGLKGDKGDKGETGAQGPQGEKGETGAQGPQGETGPAGSSFLHGHGVPTAETPGKAGDLYLDVDTWNVYEMTEDGWGVQPLGSIKGDKGDKGDQGERLPFEVTNETYGSFWLRCHDYKTMPVGVYNALTAALKGTSTIYSDYQEAGINMLIGCWEGFSPQTLDFCADYGLGYLVSPITPDGNFDQTALGSVIPLAKYHEAFCGVSVIDEPGRVQFETITETQNYLDSLMPNSIKGALWWTNVFPNYANKKQLYFRTYTKEDKLPAELNKQYPYDRYISEYMEICKPKVLSFDNYGFHVGVANRGKIRADYFDNVSIIRNAALKANVPFWHFVQDCQFGGDVFAPNQGELLWAVNTGLSFGAKGIEYFTGVKAFDASWGGALFDAAGTRTDVYNYVKTANQQIAAVDEVLMCSKSMGVMVVGEIPISSAGTPAHIPEEDILQQYGEITAATGKHTLIGCFDYNGKTAYYITNNTIQEADSDTVTLTFNGTVEGYTVLKGTKEHFTGPSLQLTLETGEGALIVIE